MEIVRRAPRRAPALAQERRALTRPGLLRFPAGHGDSFKRQHLYEDYHIIQEMQKSHVGPLPEGGTYDDAHLELGSKVLPKEAAPEIRLEPLKDHSDTPSAKKLEEYQASLSRAKSNRKGALLAALRVRARVRMRRGSHISLGAGRGCRPRAPGSGFAFSQIEPEHNARRPSMSQARIVGLYDTEVAKPDGS